MVIIVIMKVAVLNFDTDNFVWLKYPVPSFVFESIIYNDNY